MNTLKPILNRILISMFAGSALAGAMHVALYDPDTHFAPSETMPYAALFFGIFTVIVMTDKKK